MKSASAWPSAPTAAGCSGSSCEGMTLAGLGIVLGLSLAYGITRLLATLFGVKASDPVAFAAVAAVLTMVALVAAYIPREEGDDRRSGHRPQVPGRHVLLRHERGTRLWAANPISANDSSRISRIDP